MIEPLSATAAALTIATRCITAGTEIYNGVQRYRNAPDSLNSLIEAIRITRAAIAAVERLVTVQKITTLSPELEDVFPITVKGCEAVLLCIEQEFAAYAANPNWWARIRTLWKKDTMESLLNRLQRSQGHLHLLMDTMNLYVTLSCSVA